MLVGRYFLHVDCYFCSLLVNFYSFLVTSSLLLVTFCSLLVTFSQLLWAIAWLLVTRITLIYLVDEFFISSLLVLLKEMRMRGESKISSCCFCVSCKSREFRGRRSPGSPCVTLVVESSWDFLQAITIYWVESHLKSCQTSTMEVFCKITNSFYTMIISAKKLHRSCLTGLSIWSFQIKFHMNITFRIVSKSTVNCKKMVWL